MLLIYYLITITLCFVVGFGGCKLLKIENADIIRDNPLIYCVLGVLFYISVLQLFGLVLPISLVSVLLLCGSVVLLLYARCDLKQLLRSIPKKNYYLIAVLVLPAVVVSLDQIISNEIFTILGVNSDFAYYLSSIDWLSKHTILEEIPYSAEFPFYSLAKYMITLTRIGMDIFGAFLCNVYRLDAHQILPIIAMVSAGMIAASAYSVIFLFTKNKYCALLFGIYCGVCGNVIALVTDQYYAQVMGMSCLVLSVTVMAILLSKHNWENSCVCGLLVGGTMALYCEYAVHIALIAIIMLVMALFKKYLSIKHIMQAVGVAIVFYPYAIYKAIRFNMNILDTILSQGASSIDVYSGNVIRPVYLLWTLLGGTSKSYVGNYESWDIILGLISILLLLFSVVVLLIKFRNISLFWVPSLLCVCLLGGYFHLSQSGYQEYKHITSSNILIIVLVGIAFSTIYEKIGNSPSSKSFLTISLSALLMLSVIQPVSNLMRFEERVDDSTVYQLRNAADILCANEPIQVVGTGFSNNNYMMIGYALKDHAVFLNEDIETYFQYLQNFEEKDARYKLYAKKQEGNAISDNVDIIWSNDTYLLAVDKTAAQYNRLPLTAPQYGWKYGASVEVYREADCIIAQAGPSRYMLYGPYIKWSEGTYDFTFEYDAENLGGSLGTIDIYSKGNVLAQAEIGGDSHRSVVLKNIVIDSTHKELEFRVFVNEGVELKIEGILWKESAA